MNNSFNSPMEVVSSSPTTRILPATGKLLRMRIRIILSNFKRASLKQKIGLIFIWVLLFAGLAFIFGLSWGTLRLLQSPWMADFPIDFANLMENIPGLMLSAAFFGVLITSFGVLLQGLYLAGDMDFLLSLPIPIRSVFLAKLLEAILPNLAIISLFLLPVLFGMGAANEYNLLYYPFVIIVVFALSLAAAGLSAIFVMIIVRVIPAKRVAEVLGFVGAVLAILMSQIGNIINMGDIDPNDAQLGQMINLAQKFNSPWMPLSWGGRGLTALGENAWFPAISFLILVLGLSACIFGFSLLIAERWFYSGWAGMQIVTVKAKPTRGRSKSQVKRTHRIFRWLSPQIRAVIRKDWLVLRRDLKNLSQLVTPLIFGVIYSLMLVRNSGEIPGGQGQAPTWFMQAFKIALVYSSVGIAIFVGWMLLARLATMSFSQEHHNYWMIKSAPVSPRQLLTAKFIVAYLPALFLGWGFLSVISLLQKASIETWLYGLFVVAFSNAGLAGINLAFGVTGARFDWNDPRRMASTSTGCLSSLISVIYLGINLALFFGPPVLFTAVGQSAIAGQVLGGQFGGIMSLICALLPPWAVMKRIPRLAENG